MSVQCPPPPLIFTKFPHTSPHIKTHIPPVIIISWGAQWPGHKHPRERTKICVYIYFFIWNTEINRTNGTWLEVTQCKSSNLDPNNFGLSGILPRNIWAQLFKKHIFNYGNYCQYKKHSETWLIPQKIWWLLKDFLVYFLKSKKIRTVLGEVRTGENFIFRIRFCLSQLYSEQSDAHVMSPHQYSCFPISLWGIRWSLFTLSVSHSSLLSLHNTTK